jgi:hypothetical protein
MNFAKAMNSLTSGGDQLNKKKPFTDESNRNNMNGNGNYIQKSSVQATPTPVNNYADSSNRRNGYSNDRAFGKVDKLNNDLKDAAPFLNDIDVGMYNVTVIGVVVEKNDIRTTRSGCN